MTLPDDSDEPRSEQGEAPRHANGEEAVEPEFLDDEPAPRRFPSPHPGPGIWESLGWIAAFYALELSIPFAWGFASSIVETATTGEISSEAVIRERLTRQLPYILGIAKVLEILFFLAIIRWRFGRGAFRLVGFRPIPVAHLFVLALAVVPTAVFSGQMYALNTWGWEWLAQYFPVVEQLEGLSSVEAVQEMVRTTPLAVLIVTVAVLPALNEEFLFRALIGRGLVGRYGLVAGIALTSLLFGLVHLSPSQAVALLPLAVVMHVAYLSSGSIWLPVLVHFLNNALSVVVMSAAVRMEGDAGLPGGALDNIFDPGMFAASALCVAATVWLLWRLRIQWRLPDGRIRQSFAPEGPPSPELRAEAIVVRDVLKPAMALMLGLVLFTTAYIVATLRMGATL